MAEQFPKQRYHLLDTLRGVTLISMIAYHGAWDWVYLYGVNWTWYRSVYAYMWQQSICWTFILLSGFCWSMGKHHLRRGLLVFGGGAVVTLVTMLLMWEDRVIFGVLTLLGSCMLVMIPLHNLTRTWNHWFWLIFCGILFFITRDVNRGYLGFENWRFAELPEELYHGLASTFLGFCDATFYSADYFSFIPWFFLFLMGYFLYQGLCGIGILRIRENQECIRKSQIPEKILSFHIPPLSFIGRHSLIIYMLHQPVLYGILQTVFGQW